MTLLLREASSEFLTSRTLRSLPLSCDVWAGTKACIRSTLVGRRTYQPQALEVTASAHFAASYTPSRPQRPCNPISHVQRNPYQGLNEPWELHRHYNAVSVHINPLRNRHLHCLLLPVGYASCGYHSEHFTVSCTDSPPRPICKRSSLSS